MTMTPHFQPVPLDASAPLTIDGVHIQTWAGPPAQLAGGTVFGCVDQPTTVRWGGDTFTLRAGTWFVAPEGAETAGGRGLAIIVPGYRGLRQLGGPLEPVGRLRYIDGCTDTLLVAPPRRGEPCLNHLHIPAGTLQSSHTHPSVRIGVIARGRGVCVTPDGRHPLAPGLGWVIPAGLRHAFHTDDASLDVVAWHPDTDVGPTDEDHPMLNRTILA
jgi:quercetin dioxygenase-like cupin family protein